MSGDAVDGRRVESTGDAIADASTPGSDHLVGTILRREIRTVVRTRTFLLLALAVTLVLLATAWVGGGIRAGYVPTVVDLLTPLELLIPIVAVAFGYRAVFADEQRGELDVLRTYPVSSWHIIFGIYAGRALGLIVTVTVPLLLIGIAVIATDADTVRVYATHAGADSPLLFARAVVLTVVFALVVLAMALALSALASSTRSALALAIAAVIFLLVGADLAIVTGVASGVIGDSGLIYAIALSPLSAYRGLVLETAVVVASGTGPRTASPIASLISLGCWMIGSLIVAILALDRA